MSPEQYWEGDPYLTRAYYKKHRLYIDQRNQELWLQGFYVYKAVETVVSNALRKKSAAAQKYLEQPLDLFAAEKAADEEERQKERDKAIKSFEAMRKAWVQKHG